MLYQRSIKHFCVNSISICITCALYYYKLSMYTYVSYLFYILSKKKKKNEYNFNKQFLGHWVSIVHGLREWKKRATSIGIIPIVIWICFKMFVPVYSCGNVYLGSVKCHRQKWFNKSSNTFCIAKMLLIPVYYIYYIIVFNNIKKKKCIKKYFIIS